MTRPEFTAAARMAWREARRNRWRSALVVAMIALPVAGLTTGVISVRSASPSLEERATGLMGQADLGVMGYSNTDGVALDPDAYLEVLPDRTEIAVVTMLGAEATVDGVYDWVNLVDAPLDGPVSGKYRILEGRAPEAKGEAAVHPRLLERRNLDIGDTFSLTNPELDLTIVGVAVAPEELWNPVAMVASGLLDGREGSYVDLLIDLPEGASTEAAMNAIPDDLPVPTDRLSAVDRVQEAAAVGSAFGIAVLALVETGLIAAAAFTVGARRQLRALGLVAAAGGERRHTRLTVLSGGLVLGALGSVVGVALGIAGALAIKPYLDTLAGRMVDSLEFSPLFLMAAVALGTGAATLAAWGPARAAARLDAMDALAGRTPPPPPPGRLARWGMGALVVGGVVTGWGTVKSEWVVQAVGLVMMVGGFLVLIPTMVKWLGDGAHRLPTAGRLAARDTARHATRTGAAVAAAAVALAVPVASASALASMEHSDAAIPALADDQMLLYPGDTAFGDRVAEDLIEEMESALPGSSVLELRMVSWDPKRFPVLQEFAAGEAVADWTVWAMIPDTQSEFSDVQGGMLTIGDAELLTALHAEDAIDELEAGMIVALGSMRPGSKPVELDSPPQAADEQWERISVPSYDAPVPRFDDGSLPAFVVSAEKADELGLIPAIYSSGALIRLAHDATKSDIEKARTIAASHDGASIRTRADAEPKETIAKMIVFGMGSAVALAILTVAIALVASESRRDQAILAAVGADPAMRRKVAGMGGLLLAALAAVLAVPTGFIPLAIVHASMPNPRPVVVPVVTIVAVLLLVPAVAGAGAAISSKEPSTRRMLDPLA